MGGAQWEECGTDPADGVVISDVFVNPAALSGRCDSQHRVRQRAFARRVARSAQWRASVAFAIALLLISCVAPGAALLLTVAIGVCECAVEVRSTLQGLRDACASMSLQHVRASCASMLDVRKATPARLSCRRVMWYACTALLLVATAGMPRRAADDSLLDGSRRSRARARCKCWSDVARAVQWRPDIR